MSHVLHPKQISKPLKDTHTYTQLTWFNVSSSIIKTLTKVNILFLQSISQYPHGIFVTAYDQNKLQYLQSELSQIFDNMTKKPV